MFIFYCGNEMCKYRFSDNWKWYVQVKSVLVCLFICFFLVCFIKDDINKWFVCFFIFFGENVSCDFDQIVVKFFFVLFSEYFVKFFGRQFEYLFQNEVRFRDQLYVIVFDIVVYYFYIVFCFVWVDVCCISFFVYFSRNGF